MPLSPYITNISREKLKKMGKIPFRFISSNYLIVTLMHIFQFSQSVSHPPPLVIVFIQYCCCFACFITWVWCGFCQMSRSCFLLAFIIYYRYDLIGKGRKTTKQRRNFGVFFRFQVKPCKHRICMKIVYVVINAHSEWGDIQKNVIHVWERIFIASPCLPRWNQFVRWFGSAFHGYSPVYIHPTMAMTMWHYHNTP